MSAHPHQKGLLQGGKFNRRHGTVVPEAMSAVKAAKECKHVTKISLGGIAPAKAASSRLKFTVTETAVRMQVRGNNAVQLFWLYTTSPAETIKFIQDKWDQR